jgi:hypothetical protein
MLFKKIAGARGFIQTRQDRGWTGGYATGSLR